MNNANILLGTVLNETTLFAVNLFPDLLPEVENLTASKIDFNRLISQLLPGQPNQQAARAATIFQYTQPASYLGLPLSYRQALCEGYDDASFVCQSQATANAFASAGRNVYMYQYAHRSSAMPLPLWMGVVHTMDIESVFGVPLATWNTHVYLPDEVALANQVMAYWTNFAKYG